MEHAMAAITIVCLPRSVFQVMQVSQALLASPGHLEVRGHTIIAVILSRNADILVETLGFTSMGANLMLMRFVFKTFFFFHGLP